MPAPPALRALFPGVLGRQLDTIWPDVGSSVEAFLANPAIDQDAILSCDLEPTAQVGPDGVPRLARAVRLYEPAPEGWRRGLTLRKGLAWSALHAAFWAAVARIAAAD